MRVTPDMTNEGGVPVITMADFLDIWDEEGCQVTQDGENVKVAVDTTIYPSHSVWLTPDDADGFADLIKQRAAEARAAQRGELSPVLTFRQQLSPVLWLAVDGANRIVFQTTTPQGAVLEELPVANVDDVRAALAQARDFQLINGQVAGMQRGEGTVRP